MRDLSESSFCGRSGYVTRMVSTDPSTPKVVWSVWNNVNYMQAGVLASLTYAADNKRMLLQNFYQKGYNAVTKGKNEKPSAFGFPRIKRSIHVGLFGKSTCGQGIEVHKAERGDKQGDYVVLLDQPYRNLAISLLTKQNFPKEAKFPPYDDIAWTLGICNGVDEARGQREVCHDWFKLLTQDAKYTGSIQGQGTNYVINYKAQNTVPLAISWSKEQNKQAKFGVWHRSGNLPALKIRSLRCGCVYGHYSSTGQSDFNTVWLDLQATSSAISVKKQHEVTMPRIAIYHSWTYTQDEGWARFTFEQRKIPYTSIDKDDLKPSNLGKKFDVILIPRINGNVSNFIHEIPKKFYPMPYTKTPEFASHGYPMRPMTWPDT